MLATALQRLIDRNLTTVKELSEFAGVSNSTIYRWINRESQPDFDSIRLLMRHLDAPEAQEILLSIFAAGTAWQLVKVDEDLDVNRDGQVDANDALDACIRAVQHAADSLTHIRQTTRPGQRLSPEQVVDSLAMLNDAASHCHISQRILVKLSENRRSAKQIRLAE